MVCCARIDHTIRLVIQGLRALAQAQEAVRQAAILREKAEASMVLFGLSQVVVGHEFILIVGD
jgi:hypothetical protein